MEGTRAENELRIGQKIKHIRIVMNKEQKQIERRTKIGTVTDIYKHIFRVKWNDHNWLECFPKWMLESTHVERIVPM